MVFEDSGDYAFFLETDPVEMLKILSDKNQVLSRLNPESNGPSYFFETPYFDKEKFPLKELPLIYYSRPELYDTPDNLEDVLNSLGIRPEKISAQLSFGRGDIVTKTEDIEAIKSISNYLMENDIPFIMIDEDNCVIIGGYQPVNKQKYVGSGSNEELHNLFE